MTSTPTPGVEAPIQAPLLDRVISFGASVTISTSAPWVRELFNDIIATLRALPAPPAQPEGAGVGEQVREQAAKLENAISVLSRFDPGEGGWHHSELVFVARTMRDVANTIRDLPASPAPAQPAGDAERVTPSDPSVVIAGIRQFGLASDGADLRDLEMAIQALRTANEEAEVDTNWLRWSAKHWQDKADAAEAETARLKAAFRERPCPRPANNHPDDETIGSCIDALSCGCLAPEIAAALAPTGEPT